MHSVWQLKCLSQVPTSLLSHEHVLQSLVACMGFLSACSRPPDGASKIKAFKQHARPGADVWYGGGVWTQDGFKKLGIERELRLDSFKSSSARWWGRVLPCWGDPTCPTPVCFVIEKFSHFLLGAGVGDVAWVPSRP